jgi:hypothetical protein
MDSLPVLASASIVCSIVPGIGFGHSGRWWFSPEMAPPLAECSAVPVHQGERRESAGRSVPSIAGSTVQFRLCVPIRVGVAVAVRSGSCSSGACSPVLNRDHRSRIVRLLGRTGSWPLDLICSVHWRSCGRDCKIPFWPVNLTKEPLSF